jgi:hypothetical protein
MTLTAEQNARIVANMEARIKRAEALVAKIDQVNVSNSEIDREVEIDRIMVKLGFVQETIEYSTTSGKLNLILEEIDNLQRKYTKVLTHPAFFNSQKEIHLNKMSRAQGTW